MGNSATKEQRPAPPHLRPGGSRRPSEPIDSDPNSPVTDSNTDHSTQQLYSTRSGRGSRPDLSSFLGLGNGLERDLPGPESRRETKQEREARKLEKERVMRERERKRSMREESVDGGYLVTQGVYTGIEDFNKSITRQLMIERRIAPFWRGLNDHSDSWTENQLVAAARGLPIPAPDEIPMEDQTQPFAENDSNTKMSEGNENNLMVPITSRSQSYNSNSDSSIPISPSTSEAPLPSSIVSLAASPPGSTLLKGRTKTLASLTTSSKGSQGEMVPREMNLPKEPCVSGQPVEAYLYKDAAECPICFLYYPPYLNKTRCCDQAICSECFVQIKRPDPHPPEHADPTVPPPPSSDNHDTEERDGDDILVSEPAACPFCVQPEFGVTYEPPPFRRGLTYVNQGHPLHLNATSAMSSSSSLASAMSNGGRLSPTAASRRRTTSISATSPTVITTDRVRPDWHQRLTSARAHAARRSAAATALHTAAYLMGNRNHDSDGRAFPGFGRRGILRRGGAMDSSSAANSVAQQNMLALMAERYAASGARGELGAVAGVGPAGAVPRGVSQRDRVDDLEEMMMMEAIRLSLASEDERRKREDKESKKVAKRKEKENKKAEKAARKTGGYPISANQSTTGFDTRQNESSLTSAGPAMAAGKGKGIQRSGIDIGDVSATISPTTSARPSDIVDSASDAAQGHLERARALLQPHDTPAAPPSYKPSHLRTLSNVSSSASSVNESVSGSLRNEPRGLQSSAEASTYANGVNISRGAVTQDTFISGTPPGGGAGLEPMFNFSSLAAMVGEDEKAESSTHVQNAENITGGGHHHRNGESSSNTDTDHDQGGNVNTEEIRLRSQAPSTFGSEPEVSLTEGKVPRYNAEAIS